MPKCELTPPHGSLAIAEIPFYVRGSFDVLRALALADCACQCHTVTSAEPMLYFFAGAAPYVLPAAFINSSKRLRALVQLAVVSGTLQAPLPLQAFSPG